MGKQGGRWRDQRAVACDRHDQGVVGDATAGASLRQGPPAPTRRLPSHIRLAAAALRAPPQCASLVCESITLSRAYRPRTTVHETSQANCLLATGSDVADVAEMQPGGRVGAHLAMLTTSNRPVRTRQRSSNLPQSLMTGLGPAWPVGHERWSNAPPWQGGSQAPP